MPPPGHAPRLLEIFNEAAERPSPAERAAYLDVACGSDPDLRARVETLLKAHDRPDDILEPPPTTGPVVPHPPEGPGSVIGPFRLLELIGEGGMGVVYLAGQTAPVRREVALKVIRPGMDSKQVI